MKRAVLFFLKGPLLALSFATPPAWAESMKASWYGPRFYGKKTTCEQRYNPEIVGIAVPAELWGRKNSTKPYRCGQMVTITFESTRITVPVIDTGPFKEKYGRDI